MLGMKMPLESRVMDFPGRADAPSIRYCDVLLFLEKSSKLLPDEAAACTWSLPSIKGGKLAACSSACGSASVSRNHHSQTLIQ